jgi:hypothetical protein
MDNHLFKGVIYDLETRLVYNGWGITLIVTDREGDFDCYQFKKITSSEVIDWSKDNIQVIGWEMTHYHEEYIDQPKVIKTKNGMIVSNQYPPVNSCLWEKKIPILETLEQVLGKVFDQELVQERDLEQEPGE